MSSRRLSLREAFEQVGQRLFGEAWTGEEADASRYQRRPIDDVRKCPDGYQPQLLPRKPPTKELEAAIDRHRSATAELLKQLHEGRVQAWFEIGITVDQDEPIKPHAWPDPASWDIARPVWGQFFFSMARGVGAARPEVPPTAPLGPRSRHLRTNLWYLDVPKRPIVVDASALAAALRSIGTDQKQSMSASQTLIANQTRCTQWLVGQMREGGPTKTKLEYQREAKMRFEVGKKPFQAAWRKADDEVGNPAWTRPGRRTSN